MGWGIKLKVKFFSKLRERWQKDLFKKTQIRLTILYSGMIIFFLTLFIIVVYSVFYMIISDQEHDDIQTLADQELSVLIRYLGQYGLTNQTNIMNQNVIVIGEDQFFYYVVDSKGRLIFGDEVVRPLRSDLLSMLKGWRPLENEIRYETLSFFEFNRVQNKENDKLIKKRSLQLLMTGRPIYVKGQFVGVLYVGKNVTDNNYLFKKLLFLLVSLAVLFSGIAIFISYLMSKRSMIPIKRAYTKQNQFTADVSHELRTPLSVLLSSIDVLEMEVESGSEERDDYSRKLISNMRDEVKRMTKMVGDLLTLARSDSNQIELMRETFDFCPHVQKIIQSFKPLAEEKGIKLHIHAPQTLIVNGDLERLKQLLYILLDNAIKYTTDGGEVNITISMKDWDHHPTLNIQVQDTGIGISQEDQKNIFDRFYRVDKARTRQMGGHGLGLAIAKWIVEAHKGSIQVSSKLGEGSTFTIKIPQSSIK